MERYRFDDAYGNVYEYNGSAMAYLFMGSYFAFGITAKMSDAKKRRIVDKAR